MPYYSLKLNPGVDVEQTQLLNETGFSASNNTRFFEGLPQKRGGWLALTPTPLIGTCRGMHAWADLNSLTYLACGTEQRLEVLYGTTIFDITPIRLTTNPAVQFSTTATSTTVYINDQGDEGAAINDWINLVTPVSVGGIVLQGFYQIIGFGVAVGTGIPPYEITAASPATGTVTNGGAVPAFTTTSGSDIVNVLLDNHGEAAGNIFTVLVSTAVGGLTLLGYYTIATIVDANNFTITAPSNATAGATVSENGGNAQINYLIQTGLASATAFTSGGYGAGLYGAGPYGGTQGGGTTTVTAQPRQWFLDNFGQDLVGNYTGSPIYVWAPNLANPAIPITVANYPGAASPPISVSSSFVSAPQQMIIALGCDIIGSNGQVDPLLVRWCDAGDFTDWYPTATNQAGSFHLSTGSSLRGGISSPNFNVLWTDTDMWLMNYLGGSGLSALVWGFNKIASGVDLLCARGAGVYRNLVYWISSNAFFVFDGNTIQQVPCPVWDKLWYNLNRTQVAKVNCQVNSWFQEVSWAFPSAAGSGEVDSLITYNARENSWTYDDPVSVGVTPAQAARTAWIDDNVLGAPIGTDTSSLIQQHETTNDANGAILNASITTGWFSTQEGSVFAFMERLAGDFIATGGTATVNITVYAQDYPTGPIRTYGPYSWTAGSGPPLQIVRARGRFFSIQVSSNTLGVFWRLGNLRYLVSQAGRR